MTEICYYENTRCEDKNSFINGGYSCMFLLGITINATVES